MIVEEKYHENAKCMRCLCRHSPHLSCEQARNAALNAAVDRVAARHQEPVLARDGTEYVPLPAGTGALLSATVFAGKLLIACENGVWVRSDAMWRKVELDL